MFRARVLACALAVACGWTASASAWGFGAHRLMMARAIERLPPPLEPFFRAHRAELVLRVVDPDLWRTLGWGEEPPHHFLNFGVPEYGGFPFLELPRRYEDAVEKFGADRVRRNGLLPWRTVDEFENLVKTFGALGRGQRFAEGDVVLFAAVLSHYVQDAYQPFHASSDFDGQESGQRGIHGRFETDLPDRMARRLTLTPASPRVIADPRDAIFAVLLDSHQLVPRVLDADRRSRQGAPPYDDGYYERFFTDVRPLLERRLSDAATATASFIMSAWEHAGRPTLDTPRRSAAAGRRTPAPRARRP